MTATGQYGWCTSPELTEPREQPFHATQPAATGGDNHVSVLGKVDKSGYPVSGNYPMLNGDITCVGVGEATTRKASLMTCSARRSRATK